MADLINILTEVRGTGADPELDSNGALLNPKDSGKYGEMVSMHTRVNATNNTTEVIKHELYGAGTPSEAGEGTVYGDMKVWKDEVATNKNVVDTQYKAIAGTDGTGTTNGMYKTIVEVNEKLNTDRLEDLAVVANDLEGTASVDGLSRINLVGNDIATGIDSKVMAVGTDINKGSDSTIAIVANSEYKNAVTAVAELGYRTNVGVVANLKEELERVGSADSTQRLVNVNAKLDTDIRDVANGIDDITKVAQIDSVQLAAVAESGYKAKIESVYDIRASVVSVASESTQSKMDQVITNMSDINSADENAAKAKGYAENGENELVENDGVDRYSAKHYSMKSQASANYAASSVSTIQTMTVNGVGVNYDEAADAIYEAADNKITFMIPNGLQGPKGDPFRLDAQGVIGNRSDYNGMPKGFSYLSTDEDPTKVYFKTSEDDGDYWTAGADFGIGPEGPVGKGVSSVDRTSSVGGTGEGTAGSTDTYTITYTDATTTTFDVVNGVEAYDGLDSTDNGIALAASQGPAIAGKLADRYTKVDSDKTTTILSERDVGQRMALTKLASAYVGISTDTADIGLTDTAQVIDFVNTGGVAGTNTAVLDTDEGADSIILGKNATYNILTTLNITSTTSDARAAAFDLVDANDNTIVYSTSTVTLLGYSREYTVDMVLTPGVGKMADGTTNMPDAPITVKVMARVDAGTDKVLNTWSADVMASPSYELENKASNTSYDDSGSNLGSTNVQGAIEVLDDKVDGLVTTNTKNKYDASTAPVATNDSGEGYSVGSIWINTTDKEEYRLMDATVDAAVWQNTAPKAYVNGLKTVTATYTATAGQTEFLIGNTTSEPMTVLYEGFPIVEGTDDGEYTRAADKITLNTAADANEQLHIIAHNG